MSATGIATTVIRSHWPRPARRAAVGLAPSLAVVLACLAGCATPPPAAAPAPRVEYFRRAESRAPFSPAVRVGEVIYLSGQVGAAPDGSIPVGIEAQARAAMDNLAAAAKLGGATLDDVFKCTVMLEDMSQWAAFNRVYLGYFKPERLPARSAFGVDGLALGATVEVECLALAPATGRAR